MLIISTLAVVAAVAVAKPVPQGVTVEVSPSGPAPSGCTINHAGYFGLSVQAIGADDMRRLSPIIHAREAMPPPLSTISDGQVQAPTGSVSGKPPASSASGPTSKGSASGTAPTGLTLGGMPSGTTPGITETQTSTAPGSIETPTGTVIGSTSMGTSLSETSMSNTNGGSSTPALSSQSTSWVTVTSTISIQCSTSNVSVICSLLPPKTSVFFSKTASTVATSSGSSSIMSIHKWSLSVTSISTSKTFISTRKPIETSSTFSKTTRLTTIISQTPVSTKQTSTVTTSVVPVSQITDGQIQATATSVLAPPYIATTTVDPVTTISDGQVQATYAPSSRGPSAILKRAINVWKYETFEPESNVKPVACRTNSTLEVQLHHGVLTDKIGRTGYIASNYQFQFDAPAQSGALYTAGFSLCGNGSLALGNSTVFYRCLSGDFYNLYDRYIAKQCEAVELVKVELEDC